MRECVPEHMTLPVHSFRKYFLNIYKMLGTVIDTEDSKTICYSEMVTI